ncbi:putative Phytocyanin domain, cupredoxin [Dioscorea sansibarensis]
MSNFMLISCFVLAMRFEGVNGYKNYTVGDSHGWYDNLKDPKVNYQKWVAGKNFSLGDFLIFNTDKNHTVVQTYNLTIYKHCDYNDADSDDTIEWSAGEPEVSSEAVTMAVPLVKEGMNYFFSGNYDGEQCKHGQHFKINVTHGQGLPESLKSPVPDSPAPSSADDGDNVPDTVIPSNFDNPTNGGEVKAASGAAGGNMRIGLVMFVFFGILVVSMCG